MNANYQPFWECRPAVYGSEFEWDEKVYDNYRVLFYIFNAVWLKRWKFTSECIYKVQCHYFWVTGTAINYGWNWNVVGVLICWLRVMVVLGKDLWKWLWTLRKSIAELYIRSNRIADYCEFGPQLQHARMFRKHHSFMDIRSLIKNLKKKVQKIPKDRKWNIIISKGNQCVIFTRKSNQHIRYKKKLRCFVVEHEREPVVNTTTDARQPIRNEENVHIQSERALVSPRKPKLRLLRFTTRCKENCKQPGLNSYNSQLHVMKNVTTCMAF